MAHRQRSDAGADRGAGAGAGAGAGLSADPKTCVSCGRRIEWRAKWARDWDAVRYCSDACRRRGVTDTDRALEASILNLLAARPSIEAAEAAQQVGGEEWRALAEPARRAARRLVARGELEIVQGGRVVDPSTAKGPITLRAARS